MLPAHGEAEVAPEDEHGEADASYVRVHSKLPPGLGVVVLDSQLATGSGASPSRYVGGGTGGLGDDQREKDGACGSRNGGGGFEVGRGYI